MSDDAFAPRGSTTLAEPVRPPRRWLALLLSLVVPGLGQLYARHPPRAFFWMICWSVAIGLCFSPFLFVWPTPLRVIGLCLTQLAITTTCLIDTWHCARRAAGQVLAAPPWWAYFLLIIGTMGLSYFQSTWLPHTNVIRPFDTPASSMEPSLRVGDVFYAATAPRFRQDITYGDIVIFQRDGTNWARRVVGLPGDRISFYDGNLVINNVGMRLSAHGFDTPAPLKEKGGKGFPLFLETMPNGAVHEIKRLRPGPTQYDDLTVTVPTNSYFVLGDNRDHTLDSRNFGTVAAQDVIGRAAFIYWSSDWARIGQSLATR